MPTTFEYKGKIKTAKKLTTSQAYNLLRRGVISAKIYKQVQEGVPTEYYVATPFTNPRLIYLKVGENESFTPDARSPTRGFERSSFYTPGEQYLGGDNLGRRVTYQRTGREMPSFSPAVSEPTRYLTKEEYEGLSGREKLSIQTRSLFRVTTPQEYQQHVRTFSEVGLIPTGWTVKDVEGRKEPTPETIKTSPFEVTPHKGTPTPTPQTQIVTERAGITGTLFEWKQPSGVLSLPQQVITAGRKIEQKGQAGAYGGFLVGGLGRGMEIVQYGAETVAGSMLPPGFISATKYFEQKGLSGFSKEEFVGEAEQVKTGVTGIPSRIKTVGADIYNIGASVILTGSVPSPDFSPVTRSIKESVVTPVGAGGTGVELLSFAGAGKLLQPEIKVVSGRRGFQEFGIKLPEESTSLTTSDVARMIRSKQVQDVVKGKIIGSEKVIIKSPVTGEKTIGILEKTEGVVALREGGSRVRKVGGVTVISPVSRSGAGRLDTTVTSFKMTKGGVPGKKLKSIQASSDLILFEEGGVQDYELRTRIGKDKPILERGKKFELTTFPVTRKGEKVYGRIGTIVSEREKEQRVVAGVIRKEGEIQFDDTVTKFFSEDFSSVQGKEFKQVFGDIPVEPVSRAETKVSFGERIKKGMGKRGQSSLVPVKQESVIVQEPYKTKLGSKVDAPVLVSPSGLGVRMREGIIGFERGVSSVAGIGAGIGLVGGSRLSRTSSGIMSISKPSMSFVEVPVQRQAPAEITRTGMEEVPVQVPVQVPREVPVQTTRETTVEVPRQVPIDVPVEVPVGGVPVPPFIPGGVPIILPPLYFGETKPTKSKPHRIKTRYVPSITGMFIPGISKAPKGILSGLEPRAFVQKGGTGTMKSLITPKRKKGNKIQFKSSFKSRRGKGTGINFPKLL